MIKVIDNNDQITVEDQNPPPVSTPIINNDKNEVINKIQIPEPYSNNEINEPIVASQSNNFQQNLAINQNPYMAQNFIPFRNDPYINPQYNCQVQYRPVYPVYPVSKRNSNDCSFCCKCLAIFCVVCCFICIIFFILVMSIFNSILNSFNKI